MSIQETAGHVSGNSRLQNTAGLFRILNYVGSIRTWGLTTSVWPQLNYEAEYCSFNMKGDSFRQLLLSFFSLQLNTIYLIKWGLLVMLYIIIYMVVQKGMEKSCDVPPKAAEA